MKQRKLQFTQLLLLLNGLAIMAVVLNHATQWGNLALFWWTDRYRAVTVPNYDQLGSFSFYFLEVIRKLTVFAVSAFLFVSGYFIAYAAQGSGRTLRWKVVWARIRDLLIPFAIWTVLFYLFLYLGGDRTGFWDFFKELITARVYFFIPLLCQLLLLSPFLTRWAKSRWRLLLALSAALLLAVVGLYYAQLADIMAGRRTPIVDLLIRLNPSSSFVRWIFFFVLGIVSMYHLKELKQWLKRARWWLLAATVVLAVLSFLESEWVYQNAGLDWWMTSPFTLPSVLYIVALIFCFLAFDRSKSAVSDLFFKFGKASLGIFLIHSMVLEFVARVIQKFLPALLAQTELFYLVIVALGLAVPLLLMEAVDRTGLRKYHRYLFG